MDFGGVDRGHGVADRDAAVGVGAADEVDELGVGGEGVVVEPGGEFFGQDHACGGDDFEGGKIGDVARVDAAVLELLEISWGGAEVCDPG